MKKTFLLAFLIVFSTFGFSQTFLLEEYFNESINLQTTWTTFDQDGDGHNWHVFTFDTIGFAVSDSWMAGFIGALTPENYLVSPQISLTGLSGTVQLRYTIQVPDPLLFAEHYKVAVSTTGKQAADFTNLVTEETCTADDYYELYPYWHERIVDLTPYIGQNIYFTFCHYNCTDQYQLLLDSIQVSYSTDVKIADYDQADINVYPNPASEKLVVSGSFENAQMQLFTAEGRQVFQSGKATRQAGINVSSLGNGIYILKIKSQKGVITKKINILHG
jgi:hypothetical protein